MIKGKNRNFGTLPAAMIVCFAFGSVLLIGSLALAGDHLSASKSCTPCHGTNIRSIHDDVETVPVDCDTCHATVGDTWYLNMECADRLVAVGGLEVQEIVTEEGQCVVDEDGYCVYELDLQEFTEFDFACKACHFYVDEDERHHKK